MSVPVKETTFSYVDLAEKERSNVAVYGLIFIILVVLGRIQEIIPGFDRLYLGKVSFALAIILFVFSPVRSSVPILSLPQMKYLFMLLGIGIASTPFAVWSKQSLNFLIYNFGILLLMELLLVKLVVSYRDLIKVMWGGAISIAVLSLAAAILTKEGRASASATYDPNDLAFNIVCFLPVVYYLMKSQSGLRKLLAAAVIAVSFFAMLLTMSRTGFIGFVAVVLFIMIREKVGLFKIAAAGAAIAAAVFYFAPQGYTDRMQTIVDTEGEYNYSAGGGRIAIWKRGVKLMLEHPLLGTGPDTFETAEGLSHGGMGKWSTAHNSYIQIGTEFGIPGLALFIMILVTSLRTIARVRRDAPEGSPLRTAATGVEAGLVGYMVSGALLSQAYSGAFFILVGMSMVLVHLAGEEQGVPPVQAPGQLFPRLP